MAFSITENNGTFELKGNLTANNAFLVRRHLQLLFQSKKEFIINLASLDSMDTGSVFELKSLMDYAFSKSKFISFIGNQNKKISGAFLRCGIDLFEKYRQSA